MLETAGERELLRKVVRDFVEKEIAVQAEKFDREDIFPVELLSKTAELGFNGVFVPARYGGSGLGCTEQVIILEEIARYSPGFAISLAAHYLAAYAILKYGTGEQKHKYLPGLSNGLIAGFSVTEPGGGSDFSGQKSTGEMVERCWFLNGRKCFITNFNCLDINVVTVRTGENEKGRPLISAFIVEGKIPGHTPGRKEKKTGLRGSWMGEVILNNSCVPRENMLGRTGEGSKIALGTLGGAGRVSVAAISLGILRACLEDSVRFAKERQIYGRPLSRLTNIQFIIAQNRTDYEAARLLIRHAAGLKDAGAPCSTEMVTAKLFSTEAAVNAAKRSIDLMGAYGVIADYPAGRYLRDAVSLIPACGTSDIMKLIIAADELRK